MNIQIGYEPHVFMDNPITFDDLVKSQNSMAK